MFLGPGTEYEVRLVMDDPDGDAPPPELLTVATRTKPEVWQDGPKRAVGKLQPRSSQVHLPTSLLAPPKGSVVASEAEVAPWLTPGTVCGYSQKCVAGVAFGPSEAMLASGRRGWRQSPVDPRCGPRRPGAFGRAQRCAFGRGCSGAQDPE